MKKIININIQYNLLALLSVALGFIFIIALGRKLGASELTDTYFMSLVLIAYLGNFIQSTWGAMNPYYVEAKLKDKTESSKINSILLNNTIIIAIIIITIYYISTYYINLITEEQKKYLDIFIFYLLLENISLFNKNTLRLEHFFASVYIAEIFVQGVNILTVFYFLKNDITILAYSMLLATSITILGQFYLIYKKAKINYYFSFYHKRISIIYKNSIKLKFGALLYRTKDIVIAMVFTALGTGTYSLYSYANKFVSVLQRIVNAPIINVFLTRANYAIAKNSYSDINQLLIKALTQTLTLFTLSAITLYLIIPYILEFFFAHKFTTEDKYDMLNIFSYLLILSLIIINESPFSGLLKILKIFNYTLFLNFIYFTLIVSAYFIFNKYSFTYSMFLIYLILVQSINFLLHAIKYKLTIKSLNE